MNISYLLPPLVAASIGTVLLVVVLLKGRQKGTVYRIFSFLIFSIILWALLIFAMRATPDVEHAVRWDRAMLPIGFAVSVLYYHFSLTLTNIKKGRVLLLTGYLLLVVVAVLIPTSFLIQRMEVYPYGYAPVIGPALIPVFGFFYFLSIMAVYNLIKSYRTSPVREEKNRFLYITIAMVLSLVGGIFELFPSVYPTSIFGGIVFCLLTSVAVLKYHLLDIRVAIRKGTAYFLMSAMVAIPYVGLILLFTQVFKTQPIPPWVYVVLLIILALALQPLWARVQRQVDRWFYRERYDFLKELENFSQETHDISDLSQLISSLIKLISRALQSSGVYLLLTSASEDFVTVSSTGENASQLTIKSGSPLLRWLRSNEGILWRQGLDTIPQLQSLTAKETSELEKIRAELFVPLKTKEKELVGVLILSEKLSEQPYFIEDERLLLTVVSRMAIELENARLYALERITRKELQRQDEQKTEFLHSVAHELKTPLTAIISSSELLSTELSSTAVSQRQRLIRNITQSAWSMDKRVTALLDFAKMEVGDLRLRQEPVEIGLIIKEIASQLRVLFKNKEQSLKLEVPDSLPQVKADREKLEQIMVNLLSNANKFSPTGSKVTLRAREVDDRVIVEVKDSAPAITEEEKVKLFDPYYRGGDTDKRQRVPGLGLGLAISKKLVELHQGEIWVKSESGKGNTFAFSLPALDRRTKGIGKIATRY